MENPEVSPTPTPELPAPAEEVNQEAEDRKTKFTIIAVGILILVFVIAGAVFLFSQGPESTAQIRDVFIIFMALEFLIIGVALVILIVQLATLINLLQNEIKPILNSTNETVNTVKGTVAFLSNNLTEPIIKLNEYMAAIKRLVDIFRPGRK